MTTIAVDYGELNLARRKIDEVARETEDYSDFLKDRIKSKLLGISGSNVTDAVASVNQKINALNQKKIKFNELGKKIDNYGKFVAAKDTEAANIIAKVTDAFASKNGIKVSGVTRAIAKFVLDKVNSSALGRFVKEVLNRIKTVLDSVKDAIKNSMKMGVGKYIKDILVSAVAIVIAVGVTIVTGGAGIVGIAAIVGGVITVANGIANIWNSMRAIQYNKSDPAWSHKHGKVDKFSDSLRLLNDPRWNAVAGLVDLAEIVTDVIGGIDGVAGILSKGGTKLVDNFTSMKNLFKQDKGMIAKRLFEFNGDGKLVVNPGKFMNGLRTIKGDGKLMKGYKYNKSLFLAEIKGKGKNLLKNPGKTIALVKDNIANKINGKLNIGNIEKLNDVRNGIIGKHINLDKEIFKIGTTKIKAGDLIKTSIKLENLKDFTDFGMGFKGEDGKINILNLVDSNLSDFFEKSGSIKESVQKTPEIQFN